MDADITAKNNGRAYSFNTNSSFDLGNKWNLQANVNYTSKTNGAGARF